MDASRIQAISVNIHFVQFSNTAKFERRGRSIDQYEWAKTHGWKGHAFNVSLE